MVLDREKYVFRLLTLQKVYNWSLKIFGRYLLPQVSKPETFDQKPKMRKRTLTCHSLSYSHIYAGRKHASSPVAHTHASSLLQPSTHTTPGHNKRTPASYSTPHALTSPCSGKPATHNTPTHATAHHAGSTRTHARTTRRQRTHTTREQFARRTTRTLTMVRGRLESPTGTNPRRVGWIHGREGR